MARAGEGRERTKPAASGPAPGSSRGLAVALTALAVLLGAAAALFVVQLLFEEPEAETEAEASAVPDGDRDDTTVAASKSPDASRAKASRRGSSSFRTQPRLATRTPRPRPPLTSIYDWPREPVSPAEVDASRFKEAFARLCGPHAEAKAGNWYADWILQYSEQFSTDPFLLGALVANQSGCGEDAKVGVGIAGLRPELYGRDLEQGNFSYHRFEDGSFIPVELSLRLFPFEQKFVSSPQSNLYFAAGFLKTWREQFRGVRAKFVQRSEYRHYVSHYIWGDVVQSNRQEDWVLVERRRLLEYYGARKPMGPVQWRGFELSCPLDGCPRVITSTLGDAREGGKRSHRGVDFESVQGEPVHTIADGRVVFAGVDLPGKAAHQRLPLYAQGAVAKSLMGAGGLYVCIRHDHPRSEATIMSCYMHLEALEVAAGRRVKRGMAIGRVGRTGIKVSPPHLHFELHAEDGIHAADEAMPQMVLGKPPVDIVPSHVLGFEPEDEAGEASDP